MLKHKDRIIFGTNSYFLFLKKFDPKEILDVDYESAQFEHEREKDEINRKKNEANEKKKEEQLLDLKKTLEEKYFKEKSDIEQQMINKMNDYEAKLEEMNKNNAQIKLDNQENLSSKFLLERIQIEKNKKKLEYENREKNDLVRTNTLDHDKCIDKKQDKSKKLEHSLHNIVKKINKLKLILDEIGRNLHLEVFLSKNILDHINNKNSNTSILIRVNKFIFLFFLFFIFLFFFLF